MSDAIHYDRRYGTLLTVRRCLSFTAAAEELNLSQSAVSYQIHSLEEELGAVLFTTEKHALVPTRECNLVVEYVQRISGLCDRMGTDLNMMKQRMEHLAVGITPSIGEGNLADTLVRNMDKASAYHITVRTETAEQLKALLKASVIDLAVVDGVLDNPDLMSVMLDTDYLILAVPPARAAGRDGIITLKELKKENLILRGKPSGTRGLFESCLRNAGTDLSDFRVILELDDVAAIKRLVRDGYGVSVLSHKACEKDVAEGRLCEMRISNLNMSRRIGLYYRKDSRDYSRLISAISSLYHGGGDAADKP